MVPASPEETSGGRFVHPTLGHIRSSELAAAPVTWRRPSTWPISWAVSQRALALSTIAAPG